MWVDAVEVARAAVEGWTGAAWWSSRAPPTGWRRRSPRSRRARCCCRCSAPTRGSPPGLTPDRWLPWEDDLGRSLMRRTHLLVPALAAALAVSRAPGAHRRGDAGPARTAPSLAADTPRKQATVTGQGGAVTSVDLDASKIGCGCSSRAATPSTPRSPPRPRSASPSRTAPASAVAATSSTTTRKKQKVKTLDGRETAPAAIDARRVHRPGHRQALQLHPRARHQRRLGRGARHAGDLAAPRSAGGARWPCRRCSRRRPPWPARVSRSTRRSTSRPTTTPSGSIPSRRPAAVPAERQAAEGPQHLPQPAAGRHLRPARRGRHRGVLPRRAAQEAGQDGAQATGERRDRPAGAPGQDEGEDLKAYEVIRTAPRTSATAGWTSTACRRPPAAAPRSGRRSTSSSATT